MCETNADVLFHFTKHLGKYYFFCCSNAGQSVSWYIEFIIKDARSYFFLMFAFCTCNHLQRKFYFPEFPCCAILIMIHSLNTRTNNSGPCSVIASRLF